MALTKLNPFAPEYIPLGAALPHSSALLPDHYPLLFNPPLISAFPSPHQILYPTPPPPPPHTAAASLIQFQNPPHSEQERGIVLRTSSGRGRSSRSNPRPSSSSNGGPRRGRGPGEKRWTPRFNSSSNHENSNSARVSEPAAAAGDHDHGRVGSTLLKHEVVFLNSEDEKTTVMIKNIPYQYTREMLLKILDKHCMVENRKSESLRSAYDFMYLPIDFRSGMNKGYAFVNFTDPRAALKFHHSRNLMPWDSFPESHKRSLIVCARIQGLQALVSHFQKSTFYCEEDDFLPVSFNPPRDGRDDDEARCLKTFIGKRISPSERASQQQLPDPAIAAGGAAATPLI